jgi:hypothetical protein
MTILFVHGTGVRERSYEASLRAVTSSLRNSAIVKPCYWGHLGSRLPATPGSIPEYDTTKAVPSPADLGATLTDEEYRVALWSVLNDDPLYELRVLALRSGPAGEFSPGQLPPGPALLRRAREFPIPPALQFLLEQAGIADAFPSARAAVLESSAAQDALKSATSALTEYRQALARAFIAYAAAQTASDEPDSVPLPVTLDASLRDQIELHLVQILGGTDYTAAGWVREQLGGMVRRIATRRFANRRGAVTDAAYPAAGDILLYQARGAEIHDFLRREIAASPGCVILAHSLGGIACVDLLVKEQLPVECLITAGSQAPFLYEIDALQSLRYGQALPPHFPRWINIFDRRDFLSYIGAKVFPDRVRDFAVDNREPFPESHSAYWSNPAVWDLIEKEIR